MSRIKLASVTAFAIFSVLSIFTYVKPLNTSATQAVFVVDSKADSSDISIGDDICESVDGGCTLRAAIQEANIHQGPDTIIFGINGQADYTLSGQLGYIIEPSTSLPTITEEVTINGFSQAGSSQNTSISPNPFNARILIEIDGKKMATDSGQACFRFEGVQGSLIRGLDIGNCGADGIAINNSSNISIKGNYIGLGHSSDGSIIHKPNGQKETSYVTGSGVHILASHHTTIGGLKPEDRNVISGNQFGEILVDSPYKGGDKNRPPDSTHLTVQGNYFGLGADGVTPYPCGYSFGHGNSLLITNSAHDIFGGTQVGATNVIAASYEYGISIRNGSFDEKIQGNYIGTDYKGRPISSHGLSTGHPGTGISVATISNGGYLLAPHDVLIGGTEEGAGNLIASNTYPDSELAPRGIVVRDGAQKVTILGNRIYDNSGKGIDLGNEGITNISKNDFQDLDSGSNDLLNFPEYTNILEASGSTLVSFEIDVPEGNYRVELFDNTGNLQSDIPQGRSYLGFTNITSSGTGPESFSHLLEDVTSISNLSMTATEVDPDSKFGFGPTSEFGTKKPPVSDISVSVFSSTFRRDKTGDSVDYTITLFNNGPDPLNLSQFNGSGVNPLATSLAVNFLPPDVTYTGYVGSGISCQNAGRVGSQSNHFSNHEDYSAIFCKYTGNNGSLAPGQKIVLKLTTRLSSSFRQNFLSYTFVYGGLTDPDAEAISRVVYDTFVSGSNLDFINSLEAVRINNYFSHQYRTK